ncbi:hypothetical protein J2W46_004488 [Paraburkholderia strydomiana]|nr:hypothetical protein [Paraburkholderia strydomiana]
MPTPAAACLSRTRENLVRIVDERACIGQKAFSEPRQLCAVTTPFEQLCAQTRLECANLLAQRGLADVQSVRRPPEMTQFDDGQKRP